MKTKTKNEHPFIQTLNERFDGKLSFGRHYPNGKACALEAESVARGRDWSDCPETLPDIRRLNDGPWSSEKEMTKSVVPVVLAYWDWAEWNEEKKDRVMRRLVELTIRRILPPILREAGFFRKPIDVKMKEPAFAHLASAISDAAKSTAQSFALFATARRHPVDVSSAEIADNVLRTGCELMIQAAEENA